MAAPGSLPLILVVDDDPEALLLIQRLLQKGGVNNPIATATNGAEAIKHLRHACLAGGGTRSLKPALVFLDIHMPVRDGFEVLRWIRRRRAYRHAKVVMLSSSDDAKDLARAGSLSVDAYLYKFPSPAVLAATVHQAFAARAPTAGGTAARRAHSPSGRRSETRMSG